MEGHSRVLGRNVNPDANDCDGGKRHDRQTVWRDRHAGPGRDGERHTQQFRVGADAGSGDDRADSREWVGDRRVYRRRAGRRPRPPSSGSRVRSSTGRAASPIASRFRTTASMVFEKGRRCRIASGGRLHVDDRRAAPPAAGYNSIVAPSSSPCRSARRSTRGAAASTGSRSPASSARTTCASCGSKVREAGSLDPAKPQTPRGPYRSSSGPNRKRHCCR